MKLFIDANVIVYAFTKHKNAEACRSVLAEEFVTDALCIAEAFHALCKILKDRDLAERSVKSLFGRGEILVLDRNLLFRSLKEDTLDVFDAIHYAAAKKKGCAAIVTYDKHFDGLDVKRVEP